MRLSCPHCQCYLMDHTLKGWKACFGCSYRTDGSVERDVGEIEKLDQAVAAIAELEEYLDEKLDHLFGRYND